MYARLTFLTLIALVIETNVAAAPPAMHRWTDRTGKFSTDAEFVEIKQDSVVLKKADGSTVTLPLARLSDADREYLSTFLKPDSKSSKDRASSNLTSSDALTEPPAGKNAPVRWPGMERYPLRPDGTPDFEKYILNLYRKGVTPENNSAVLLWQAMWPASAEVNANDLIRQELLERSGQPGAMDAEIEKQEAKIRTDLVDHFGALYEELSLPGPPPKQDVLHRVSSFAMQHRLDKWSQGRGVPRYLRSSLGQFQRDGFTFDLIIEEAQRRLWTSAMIPPLAEWVQENEGPLNQIVAASRRPRYYAPPLKLLDESDQPLEYAMFDHHSDAVYRTGIPALATRAMWRLGEGRSDAARQDILAIHRLARLIGQQDPSSAMYASVNNAREATLTMLTEAQLSGAQAREVLQDLSSLSAFSGTSEWLDKVVRAAFLDLVLRLKTGRTKVLGREEVNSLVDQWGGQDYVFEYFDTAEKAYFDQIHAAARQVRDWDAVLQLCDDYADRVVAAIRMPAGAARNEALTQIETEWKQAYRRNDAERQLRSFENLSQQEQSNVFASAVIGLLGPHPAFGLSRQNHANTTLELTRLAAALAVYRAEQGQYPDKLDDLLPEVLATLPVDSYNAKPFVYKRDGEGYFLYSVGENGVDDGGSWLSMELELELAHMSAVDAEAARKKIPVGADDQVSFRLPRPAFDWSELLSPK